MIEKGLYLCATPIGNLEDITLRVLRTLRECDAIYAEDTRHTRALLNHFSIKKPVLSCHKHNEAERAQEIVSRVTSGAAIAFVSDAGMPGISDPGARLLAKCVERGEPVTVLPGASAALTALVLSGMDPDCACFAGFLPRDKRERQEKITGLSRHRGPLILYESPLRVAATTGELKAILGDRRAALARELTKLHEQCVRATLGELEALYADEPPKGECVLVVEGAPTAEGGGDEDPRALIARLLVAGMSAKDAAKHASAVCNIGRNEAYMLALDIKTDGEDK